MSFTRYEKDTKTAYTKGVEQEEIAKNYLIKNGYEIVAQRYKTSFGELDIVATLPDNLLVIVEVKYRRYESNIHESITYTQRRRIQNGTLSFISKNPPYIRHDVRFDAIFMTPQTFEHLKDAWRP